VPGLIRYPWRPAIRGRTRRRQDGKYWVITFIGYGVNLLAVPAMALAGKWQIAAALVLAERIGRAMRKPTVEAMLSYTTGELGKGWVYAVNTALGEIGAMIGPLFIALVLLLNGDYRTGYALLLISALLAFASVIVARINFPLPSRLEKGRTAGDRIHTIILGQRHQPFRKKSAQVCSLRGR
jgi:hypothetical protein